jgi:hypothetical protein
MENLMEALGCCGENEEVSRELAALKHPAWENLLARLKFASGKTCPGAEKEE